MIDNLKKGNGESDAAFSSAAQKVAWYKKAEDIQIFEAPDGTTRVTMPYFIPLEPEGHDYNKEAHFGAQVRVEEVPKGYEDYATLRMTFTPDGSEETIILFPARLAKDRGLYPLKGSASARQDQPTSKNEAKEDPFSQRFGERFNINNRVIPKAPQQTVVYSTD